jgi:hypothetical protein
MTQTLQGEVLSEYSEYEDRTFAETPFLETRVERYAEPLHERTGGDAVSGGPWHFETPFETENTYEAGGAPLPAPEVAAFAEITADLQSHLFREALEGLASEALETHGEQLAGEYGDREFRDASAERVLSEHFAPLAAHADAMLDRFFERVEGYAAESLTDTEIDRLVDEIAPVGHPFTPASEQFLGGLLRKAGKLVSGAVRLAKRGVEGAVSLAGKGLQAIGKLALGPLLKGLKKLGVFLLKHVVRFALGQLPPALRPLGQKLSDRLFRALGEAAEYESEYEEREQSEAEGISAGADVARMEAEFDVMAAQLLLTPDEAEVDHLVSTYGEAEAPDTSLRKLDDARAALRSELARLQTGESAQPVMEQFIPAVLWPVAKTAITIMGRPKLVSFIGGMLAKLVKPMIGADAANLLAPAIADAGLRIFGLEAEAASADPRHVTAEALAATVEETVNRVAELPPATFENETELDSAIREAFEDAAATYFPNTHIKPELRETIDRRGVWSRMPVDSHRKRYAKYSDAIPVTIAPRVADGILTFGGGSLGDYVRDRTDAAGAAPIKTNLRLIQVLPGATTSSIARAEGVHPRDLHPLTAQAAGALLGPAGAALGPRLNAPRIHLGTPHHLHLRQRLYYIEPPNGRARQTRTHPHLARTELAIDLPRGEIRLWLYISEPLVQRIALELGKSRNGATAFRLVRPLVVRAADMLRSALLMRHLPPALRIVGETPLVHGRVPHWLTLVGNQLAAKVAQWASQHVALYLRNNAEQFRRLGSSPRDGLTLCVTMSRVPGIDVLRQIERGQFPRAFAGGRWLHGEPTMAAVATPGYAIR